MKKIMIAAYLTVLVAAVFVFVRYGIRKSYVDHISSQKVLTSTIKASSKPIMLLLNTPGNTAVDVMFNAAAKTYSNKILFLEVNPRQIPKAGVGLTPAIIILSRQVGFVVIPGTPPSQAALDGLVQKLIDATDNRYTAKSPGF